MHNECRLQNVGHFVQTHDNVFSLASYHFQQPLSSTNFLHELDRVTQSVISVSAHLFYFKRLFSVTKIIYSYVRLDMSSYLSAKCFYEVVTIGDVRFRLKCV